MELIHGTMIRISPDECFGDLVHILKAVSDMKLRSGLTIKLVLNQRSLVHLDLNKQRMTKKMTERERRNRIFLV